MTDENLKEASFLNNGSIPWILWFFSISLLVVAYLSKLATPLALDDWAVMRASSYIAAFPDDPIVENLKQHLLAHKQALGIGYFDEYQLRFDFFGNYTATDFILQYLESLPIFSVYQSVFIALLLFHVLSFAVFILILRWQLGSDYRIPFLIVILSVFPVMMGVFEIYMFSFRGDNWLHTLPRSAMLFLMFSAYLVFANPADKPMPKIKRYVFLAGLILASILLHRSMAIMYILLGFGILSVHRLFRVDPVGWVEGRKLRGLLLPYNLGMIVIAVVKFVIFYNFGVRQIGPSIIGVSWIILVNLVIYLWIKIRTRLATERTLLFLLGNFFLNLLIPISFVALGLELIVLNPGHLRWSNQLVFYIMEVGARLGSAVHLLWWLVLGLIMFAILRFPSRQIEKGERNAVIALLLLPLIFSPTFSNFLFFALIFLLWQLSTKVRRLDKPVPFNLILVIALGVMTIRPLYLASRELILTRQFESVFDCELLYVHSSTYLDDHGVDAYQDEIIYFHSIANELRAKHYPSAPIMDDFSCRVIPSLGLR